MDSNIVDDFIQKKRLYKFQAALDMVELEYYNHMFPSPDYPTKFAKEEMISQIEALELLNFKNRAIMLSHYNDIKQNQQEILIFDQKVKQQWKEVKKLQLELEKAEQAKQNKMKYNKISKELVKYCQGENIDGKIQTVKQEIKQIDTQIERKFKKFASKEKLFKKSIAGLRSFLELFNQDDHEDLDESQDKIGETGHDQEQ